jgi:hypothetical protein
LASAFLRFYGEKFSWPNFLVETVKATPWPALTPDIVERLELLVRHEVDRRRKAYKKHEPFHEFTTPALLAAREGNGELKFDMCSLLGEGLEAEIASAYGLTVTEENVLERDLREAILARRTPSLGVEEGDDEDDNRDFVISTDEVSEQEALVSYALGCAFGRWDVRIGRDPSLAPMLPGPFEPIPVCPPGLLLGPDGMPATPGAIVSEEWLRARPDARSLPPQETMSCPAISSGEYPLTTIPWDGILVDDEGHDSDVVGRVREVMRVLFDERADEAEQELCEKLDIKNLRTYFRNPRKFFSAHIGRYSKSRRKAPIYWLLQTDKKSYGLWLYCHRLTKDTLFHAVRSYVEPKIQHEEGRRHELRRQYETAKVSGNVVDERKLAKDLDGQESLVAELTEFKANLEAVAFGRLPRAESGCPGWDPDFDDGVILNIAPLHSMVPWKEAAKAWSELADGKYEWSHVAMRFWPSRVRQLCRDDRSIAIAHGLEKA